VSYTWNASTDSTPGYVCQSDTGTTCPDASHITVSQQDNGCSNDDGYTNNEIYTLLFVQSDSTLNVGAGHHIDIAINGSISLTGNALGNHSNFNWPHFDCGTGQGGSGVEINATTVYCGANCNLGLDGVSTIRCDANAQINNPKACNDDTTATDYSQNYNATFQGSGPYEFKVEMGVTAPTGSASNNAFLYSLGTHIVP
jgi:hypothetical protein